MLQTSSVTSSDAQKIALDCRSRNMPRDYPHPFILHRTSVAADIEGLHHTNNAVYVQWCEAIGWEHSEALGLGLADCLRLNRAMERRFQLVRDADQAVILRGRWDLVCTEVSSGKARRMPVEFAPYLSAVVERHTS